MLALCPVSEYGGYIDNKYSDYIYPSIHPTIVVHFKIQRVSGTVENVYLVMYVYLMNS